MEIDVQALAAQAKAQFSELMWANLMLAGQLGASQKQVAALEAELSELKTQKPQETKE